MLENTTSRSSRTSRSQERQVKAMLDMLEDLGYEVLTGDTGEWTVSVRTDRGESTVVGVDSAREVATAAKTLADSLQVDHKPAVLHAH